MTKFAYFNGTIRPIEEAQISIMNLTFNYGIGCFGGLRGYWNPAREEINVFRIHDHYRRFLNSTKMLMAQFDYTVDQLVAITLELLSRENWQENCYIRPLAYKANTTTGGVQLHDLEDAIAIFARPSGKTIQRSTGLMVGVSSWRRVDDTAIPARGKLIGSYVNSAFVKSDIKLSGFDEAIVLSQDGHVSEGSIANFFMVREGVLLTPPVYANSLEGITRRTVIELAQAELGLRVVERDIDRTELYVAEEAFFCGTGIQIAPILSIDHRTVGKGQIGSITNAVMELYFRVVTGQEAKYQRWLTPVPQLERV
ncbi:MAG: branched-chain amino acid transaminase [Caldilineaceae bacterium]